MTFKKLNATSDIDLWPCSLLSYWLLMKNIHQVMVELYCLLTDMSKVV